MRSNEKTLERKFMIKLKSLLEVSDSDIVVKYPKGEDEITNDEYTALDWIVKTSGIRILSDKELNSIYYVNGVVVGGLYTGYHNNEFSFDIAVHSDYRRQGIGKRMIKDGIYEFRNIFDGDPDARCVLDVVNSSLIGYLKTLGFRMRKRIGNHAIMVLGMKHI